VAWHEENCATRSNTSSASPLQSYCTYPANVILATPGIKTATNPGSTRVPPDGDRPVGFVRYARGIVPCSHQNREEYSLMYELEKCSIVQRLSLASRRYTTKLEDMAYCLLGIFSVAMPLVYGEGSHAFVRLQEEIIKRSGDQSILAFAREAGWPSNL